MERDIAQDKAKIDVVKHDVAKHFREYLCAEPLYDQSIYMCGQTENLIRDNQKMVTTIESVTRGQDGDVTINAMNNAIKALEEELERHKNQKEVHKSAMHNSKVEWNRCNKEYK